jgi:hypothetical protein
MAAITLAINYELASVGTDFYNDSMNSSWGMASRLPFQALK